MGELSVLNVGVGDTKISFDPSKPAEVKRACAMVVDMLKRGFAILIEAGKDGEGRPLYRRAHDFDPETAEYIIAGDPPEQEEAHEETEAEAGAGLPAKRKAPRSSGRGAKAGTSRVPAAGTKAVAVARVAGG